LGRPPEHRLYGKLILTQDGEKRYLAATEYDLQSFKESSRLLAEELRKGNIRLPQMSLSDGHNTRQVIAYNYRSWRDFFNQRQLLALGWLQEEISKIADQNTRDAFFTLFSGTLEFNNLFASYKGEGTGAVRHMFSHHILKPERTPIEANVWGTHKSSGSFLNLFKTRMTRLMDYRMSPFEVKSEGTGKSPCSSASFSGVVDISSPPRKDNWRSRGIYLSCNSSDQIDLPDESIDYIVTDPPFFDNVHYSELADFFYAWQSLYPRGFIKTASTTRSSREVQDTNPKKFAQKLLAVFHECNRVLKNSGLLVFSYHHSRPEGWVSLVEAIFNSNFSIINAHPVKAEMSVAAPKSQAKDPIQLDVILVCKKLIYDSRMISPSTQAFEEALKRTRQKLDRLISSGLTLSKNDRRITLISQFLAAIGPISPAGKVIHYLESHRGDIETAISQLPHTSDGTEKEIIDLPPAPSQQRAFNFAFQ
jgi:putative DNA methylase